MAASSRTNQRKGAFLTKRLVEENDQPKKIARIEFALFSPADMIRVSEFQVSSRELYQLPARTPTPNGCLDPRLGISEKAGKCATCHQRIQDCMGHFGFIKLQLPIFHIGYFKQTLSVLSTICKSCARVLLSPSDRVSFLRRIRNDRLDALAKASVRKKIVDTCKKVTECPHCHALNGTVKKVAGSQTLKIVHEKFRNKSADEARGVFLRTMDDMAESNPDVAQHRSKAQEVLSPLVVHSLFCRITDHDCELLWTDRKWGRPERLILCNLLVPPVPIRPSVAMDAGAGSNEDDLTVKLQEIIHTNNALKNVIAKGASNRMLMEHWDFLQVQVAQYMNGEMPGLPRSVGAPKPIRGLCQRLKGKSGRFRGNLSGKRVDFSGRTVISPDPNLAIDQVGVPKHVAKVMTYPEKVTRHNIERLRERIRNGPDVHPGANVVRPANSTGFTRSLAYGDRNDQAAKLRFGDVVERHMEDGDIVLFNRQPSLHKLSIMSHRAKVMDWRTFRFNECVCAPYNADFDGDEMNMHIPQTEEARAEADMLLGVKENLITPRNGEPLVAATQDFLTAAYLLTQREVFMDRDEFCQVVGYISDCRDRVDLPKPAILKPVELWTGKQVVSLLVKPNKDCPVDVNLELKERHYTEGKYLCRNDGYVCFFNSELVTGNLCKKTLGDGSKRGLFYVLIRDHSTLEAARAMGRLAKLCARWLGNHRGFSIGIDDVTPSPSLKLEKKKLIDDGYVRAADWISQYERGEIENKAGCNELQTLESELNGLLGKLREKAGEYCMGALPVHNNPRVMAECGSKGSPLNISQMVACVGQQAVGGQRIPEGFVNRTLPHFPAGALTPAAKGFVANSFFSGLTATEFFFHTMGGREGLVDTAVKTAETGYMARRLMKALEDLSAHYDTTVRNSENSVVQFTYGDDGLNPAFMEGGDRPVDFDRVLRHQRAHNPCPSEPAATADEMEALRDEVLAWRSVTELQQRQTFENELRAFFDDQAAAYRALRERLGLLEQPACCQGHRPGCAAWREASRAAREGGGLDSEELDELVRETIVINATRVTHTQLKQAAETAVAKYRRAIVEPGEAVGAVGAQSIGEPGTQMTLKTFHFAGVASMNVTLGVPRLKEIINASKAISTPIITAHLVQNDTERVARIVKGRIERTTLGEVTRHMFECHAERWIGVVIKLDTDLIEALHLDVTVHSVAHSLLSATGAKAGILRRLDTEHIEVDAASATLVVHPPTDKRVDEEVNRRRQLYHLQQLRAALPKVLVSGIQSVSRAVINKEHNADLGRDEYHLLVEGYGLEDVIGADGVDGTDTCSNHLLEVEAVLGVEAARKKIGDEISFIMDAYGISIDRRHLLLLSELMCARGMILGITRFGIAKMKESVLMLASFEKTADHLFDAAVHSRRDEIRGVSESIVLGSVIDKLGTGLFKLLFDAGKLEVPAQAPLLVDEVSW